MGLEALGLNLDGCPRRKDKPLVGSESGEVIVCGSGRCVWDDLGQLAPNQNTHFMCVNDVGMHLPYPVRHWYSNDDLWLARWSQARRPMYAKNVDPRPPLLHTHSKGTSSMNIWPWPGHGTSGLNAVYTALALGYDSVVICGIPLDDTGHYFDPPWIRTNFTREAADRDGEPRYWSVAKKRIFEGRVRSMSGRTKALL